MVRDQKITHKIILKSINEPKISKKFLEKITHPEKLFLFNKLWNLSIDNFNLSQNNDLLLNIYLAYEDTKIFKPTEYFKELLFNGFYLKIVKPVSINRFTDFSNLDSSQKNEIVQILEDNYSINKDINPEYFENLSFFESLYIKHRLAYPIKINTLYNILSINSDNITEPIKRLMILNNAISKYNTIIPKKDLLNKIFSINTAMRTSLKLSYPPKKILIVEGITEEVLIPKFANLLGKNFFNKGIHLISAGGKNQASKLYLKYKEILNIPICILFDSDAEDIINTLKPTARTIDRILLIQIGEFEDILTPQLICNTLNKEFMLSPQLLPNDISLEKPITDQLIDIWRKQGLGDFNKSHFANIIHRNLDNSEYLSDHVKKIIEDITSIYEH